MPRVFVGAGAASSPQGSSAATADTAFLRRSEELLSTVSPALRQHPSAAPSPILRVLLVEQSNADAAANAPRHRSTVGAGTDRTTTTTATAVVGSSSSSSGKTSGSASHPDRHTPPHATASVVFPPAAVELSALARRGIAPKDPLAQRLAKRNAALRGTTTATTTTTTVPPTSALTSRGSASSAASHAEPSAVAAVSRANTANDGGSSSSGNTASDDGAGFSEHWTHRRLSQMTSTSWAVFREQLGIELVVVNRRVPPSSSSTLTSGAGEAVCSSATVPSTGPAPSLSSVAATSAPRVTVDTVAPIRCWEEAQLPYTLGRVVGARYGLPTAIQAQCVPLVLARLPQTELSAPSRGDGTTKTAKESSEASAVSSMTRTLDVLGVAETGSGKTAAYLVPVLASILQHRPKLLGHDDRIALGPLAIVLVPTRELAEQVTREALLLTGQSPASASSSAAASRGKSYPTSQSPPAFTVAQWEKTELEDLTNEERAAYVASHNMLSELHVVKVVGGESSEEQYERLSRGAHLVIGTIGQLQALLDERYLSLGNTTCVVIDEADRMIEENQQDALIAVLERCPLPRQTLLFTATLSAACAELARKYMSPDGYVRVRTPHRCASIKQSFELFSVQPSADSDGGTSKEGADRRRGPRGAAAPATGRGGEASNTTSSATTASRERTMHPLVHPLKFARLVTWLAYGTGPIVVFANEKRTCDVLQDELRLEAEHLSQLEESFTMDVLLGAPPEGLVFTEDRPAGSSGSPISTYGSGAAAAGHPHPRRAAAVRLENLTSVAVVHSELSQAERRRLVEAFQRGDRRVLLTTDLLARGLDVPGVTLVVNYDMPWPSSAPAASSSSSSPSARGADSAHNSTNAEEALVKYIHRIGRTGRAGATGVTVSFIALPNPLVQHAVRVTASSESGVTRALQRLYAPGTSDAVKARNAEQWALTHSKSTTEYGADDGTDQRDEDGEEDSSTSGEEEDNDGDDLEVPAMEADEPDSADGGPARQRRRGELLAMRATGRGDRVGKGRRGKANGAAASSFTFASDEELLRPLWNFLVQCAEGNGYANGGEALRRHAYCKVDVPSALAWVMADHAQRSRFGTITL